MKLLSLWLCALAIAGLTGCSQRQKVEASNQAQRAGDEIKQAASKAQKDVSDGSITFKVKTAMTASDKLDTSEIDVDTKDKVVHLKGTVPTADQKARAERIAQDVVGEDVSVMSHITVRTAAPPKRVK
jgi:hyperosmotically inducible periplasmic protein